MRDAEGGQAEDPEKSDGMRGGAQGRTVPGNAGTQADLVWEGGRSRLQSEVLTTSIIRKTQNADPGQDGGPGAAMTRAGRRQG